MSYKTFFNIFIFLFLSGCTTSDNHTSQSNDKIVHDINASGTSWFESFDKKNVEGDTIVAYTPPPIGSRYGIGKFIQPDNILDSEFTYEVISHSSSINGTKGWAANRGSHAVSFFDRFGNEAGNVHNDNLISSAFPSPKALLGFPMKPGTSWETNWNGYFVITYTTTQIGSGNVSVLGWETITVPAGTFKTLKLTYKGQNGMRSNSPFATGNTIPQEENFHYWFAPKLGIIIKKLHLPSNTAEQLTYFVSG